MDVTKVLKKRPISLFEKVFPEIVFRPLLYFRWLSLRCITLHMLLQPRCCSQCGMIFIQRHTFFWATFLFGRTSQDDGVTFECIVRSIRVYNCRTLVIHSGQKYVVVDADIIILMRVYNKVLKREITY